MSASVSWATVDSFAGNFTSPALTFYRPCPVCSSLRSRVVLELNDFQFYTDSSTVPKRVDVRENQCLDCFALYLNPCYSNYGFQVLFAEAGQSYGSAKDRPSEQIQWLAGSGLLQPGMQVLDVGCYDGLFLARLPQDVKKMGVDIDAPAIERGRRQWEAKGIEFVLGDFESFQYSGTPDTITMFHVLEHLPRLGAALCKLRSIAHSGTRLVVEVPILERGITNDINGLFLIQHMTHFTRRSLQNCLAQAGWSIVEWYEQLDYNGCRVLAKPSEVTSCVVRDPQDVFLLHNYLSAWYQALFNVERSLMLLADASHCIVWGGGTHTEFLYHTTSFFHAMHDRKYAILDTDPLKQGKTWRGIPIHDLTILTDIDWCKVWLLISSYGSQETIACAAREMGIPDSQMVRLYEHVKAY